MQMTGKIEKKNSKNFKKFQKKKKKNGKFQIKQLILYDV